MEMHVFHTQVTAVLVKASMRFVPRLPTETTRAELTKVLGDILIALNDITEIAYVVMGSVEDSARKMLTSPQRALNGRTPIEMLDTPEGVQEVRDFLARVDHGVYT
jgi:putative toxin-antitoxin system antitoxin component (TIGR02293 family)